MNVSFHVARIWQTANTSPEVFWGPKDNPALTPYSYPYYFVPFFFPLATTLGAYVGTTYAISMVKQYILLFIYKL
jgi:hypothetical protein